MYKGIWFFGMSGVGKTFSSNYLHKNISQRNTLLIDADLTRKYVNFDLGFNIKDRETVIKRNFGIAIIGMASNCFPIVCSVYMNNSLGVEIEEKGIQLIQIIRNMDKIVTKHSTYKNKRNIVGVDIEYPRFDFNLINLQNTEDQSYLNHLDAMISKIK